MVSRRVADKFRSNGYAKVALVDNRAGVGGRLAVEELRRQPADGTVMLLTPASMVTLYPHIYSKLSYKVGDVTPVCTACNLEFGFGVGPGVPDSVNTLKAFLDWAARQSGQGQLRLAGSRHRRRISSGRCSPASRAWTFDTSPTRVRRPGSRICSVGR